MKNIYVTGATGKSGKHFIRTLKENSNLLHDMKFHFFTRATSNTKIFSCTSYECDLFCGTLDSSDDLKSYFKDASGGTLLHIAGIHSSLSVVKEALSAGITRMILVHTTGIYSKYKAAGELYRQTELEIREMIKNSNTSLTILRPTMIYGNLNDRNLSVFIKMVDKLRIFPVVSGAKFALQPVWCKDLGDAYFQVLMNSVNTKNKDYILSGGNEIYLIDILKTIADQLGVKNTYISCPYIIAYLGSWGLYCCSLRKIDYREKVQRLVEPRIFSHQEASQDFGYSPVEFEIGIQDEIKQYKIKFKNDI